MNIIEDKQLKATGLGRIFEKGKGGKSGGEFCPTFANHIKGLTNSLQPLDVRSITPTYGWIVKLISCKHFHSNMNVSVSNISYNTDCTPFQSILAMVPH